MFDYGQAQPQPPVRARQIILLLAEQLEELAVELRTYSRAGILY